jgi:hypothetical protein
MLAVTRTALSPYIRLLVIGLIILLALGCTSQDTTEDITTPSQSNSAAPMLMIQRAPGEIVAADDIAEIQDVLPFELILPENLPLDLQLRRVSAHLPHDRIADQAKDENTSVVLGFRNGNATAGFELYKSLSPPRTDPSGVEPLRLDDTIVKVDRNEERPLIAAVWEGCDIGFFLTGGPPDQLTDAILLHIVEATLKGCE